jgi:hypothetical protein
MSTKIRLLVVVCASLLCANSVRSQTENKYTTSLKQAVQKLSVGEKNRDTSLVFPFLDSNIAFTARGETQTINLEVFKKMRTQMFTNPGRDIITTYEIEEVKAGSTEPVWCGYDKGTFTQSTTQKNGQYKRTISGPYYRAWKLENGQWKCYVLIVMAFTCEGNDCQ